MDGRQEGFGRDVDDSSPGGRYKLDSSGNCRILVLSEASYTLHSMLY